MHVHLEELGAGKDDGYMQASGRIGPHMLLLRSLVFQAGGLVNPSFIINPSFKVIISLEHPSPLVRRTDMLVYICAVDICVLLFWNPLGAHQLAI